MKGQPSVWRRTLMLTNLAWQQERRRIDRILCQEEGIDPEEFARDCAVWEERFKRAGATTLQEKEALIAAELGIPVEELAAEAEAIAERALAIRRGSR